MSETHITSTIHVDEEEIKLAVFDDKYMEPKYRWDKLHTYFRSLELSTIEKLGISVSAYRLYLEQRKEE